MTTEPPIFRDKKYWDYENWKLKDDVPDYIQKDYEEYMALKDSMIKLKDDFDPANEEE